MTRPTVTRDRALPRPGAELAALGATLGRLTLAPGDEVLIADNRAEPARSGCPAPVCG